MNPHLMHAVVEFALAAVGIPAPMIDAVERARLCRIEAARATSLHKRHRLLALAAKYEAIAGRSVDPDDPELQGAVADRLHQLAAKKRRPT
jgi:hypothetical protein